EASELGEVIRERLEARHDPVRLKEHYFFLMWRYYQAGQLTRSVETCDLGIELAAQLGSAPVQYGSIKAMALADLGRFDAIDAALAQEVADELHPFGRACRDHARAVYLGTLEAYEPAAVAAREAMEQAAKLSRVWMQQSLLNLAAVLAAFGPETVADEVAAIKAIGEGAGLRPQARCRAEEQLAAGRPGEVVELLGARVGRSDEESDGRELAWTLECLGRARLVAGDPEGALVTVDRGLTLTGRTGQMPVSWRLHGCRAEALAATGRQ